ncbi:sensor histidine kinase [Anaerosacchariphilus polymeriproducens]|uniref:histidine kinase n=1 Tax=Anaerosacchariphilus polymeriproducens TaxID=1812858 RepID=A0A371ATU2_9FIRM|nr:HAMP domain-containing sensor histidine kinase [Anaerosacchariphilus polymeriproducens]RDU22985.1 sensor histidine kinase [Anaerosacchariphilus polymeriproducens]
MKHKKLSIKWKIFYYLFSFTIILLIILWLLQIVYLDNFYKIIKTNKLNRATDLLIQQLNQDDMNEIANDLVSEYEISICIMDKKGFKLVSAAYSPNSPINNISYEKFLDLYSKAEENGGDTEIYEDLKENKKSVPEINPSDDSPDIYDDIHKPKDTQFGFVQKKVKMESLIKLSIQKIQGKEYLIMINSVLTPIDSTVSTLQVELICISIILFVLSIGIAFLMSKKITKSIIRINKSAKELAKGNFQVVFDGNDYREIAELSDTLNYTSKELGRTEAYQQELIANVSHDLRTPLTMIIAYSEGMRDLPGENTPENIQVVIDEAKRLTNLVNDMLDISKLQSGVIQIEKRKYNLTKSIESVMERYTKLKEQEGYNISFEYDREVYITADEFKIYQVIYNMVNNAINYTGEDKQVKVRQIVNDNKVRIQVEDSGPGIKKADMQYVWERYYKVDKEHKRAIAGTGLGLSISKNILELHQGEYGVESIEKKGSIFWFQFEITK